MTNWEIYFSTPDRAAMFCVEIGLALEAEAKAIPQDLGESYIGVSPPIDVIIERITRGSSPKSTSGYAISEWLYEEAS